jgi:hypothetical protein
MDKPHQVTITASAEFLDDLEGTTKTRTMLLDFAIFPHRQDLCSQRPLSPTFIAPVTYQLLRCLSQGLLGQAKQVMSLIHDQPRRNAEPLLTTSFRLPRREGLTDLMILLRKQLDRLIVIVAILMACTILTPI